LGEGGGGEKGRKGKEGEREGRMRNLEVPNNEILKTILFTNGMRMQGRGGEKRKGKRKRKGKLTRGEDISYHLNLFAISDVPPERKERGKKKKKGKGGGKKVGKRGAKGL